LSPLTLPPKTPENGLHKPLSRHCPEAVEVMGRYSNPDNVTRLNRILSGQGRDRPSHRPVPSLKQKQTRLADSDRHEVIERYLAGETAKALASIYDVNRATVFAILRRAGIK
jgi:hypothetical protein